MHPKSYKLVKKLKVQYILNQYNLKSLNLCKVMKQVNNGALPSYQTLHLKRKFRKRREHPLPHRLLLPF